MATGHSDLMTPRHKHIAEHYSRVWANEPVVRKWAKGPVHELPADFHILEFNPSPSRYMWTYATCCMSEATDDEPCELFLFSRYAEDLHVELLTIVAHYHRTGQPLGLGHTVNFGRPWLPGSLCDHGLISLPYLDGPALEWLTLAKSDETTRFLWLIPITEAERDFRQRCGLEALEQRFEAASVDYLEPLRPSIV